LNFDYRGFGASDAKAGEPRQIVDIPAQLDDWRAAISYAQQSPDVDGTKLAVWGSSLGGGHAITMAAEHPEAKALVAQVPHCCSNAAFKTVALGAVFKGMSYSIADNLRGLFGMKPLLVPVLSQPNEYGVMNHPGWKDHYLSLVNAESRWQNQIPARSLIKSGQYRPVLDAGKIAMPALLVYGRHDAGVPASSVEEAGAKMSNAELMPFEGDHFDVYGGPLHPGIVEKQTAFLVANLLP
jgi:pimeloyl-ACP methyl ester carboxylesterase